MILSPTNRVYSHTTFVSAFIKDINYRADRSVKDYLELGEHFLKTSFQKVIFMDRAVFADYIYGKQHLYPSTQFIPIDKSDIYLYEYKSKANNFCPITNNPRKDTYEFFMVQCMKTEWIKQSIENNFFGSDDFVWIDFGIYHFIANDEELMSGMTNVARKKYPKVRIAITNPPDFPHYSRNILNHIIWMFAGSMFGGGKRCLLKFAEVMRAKCIELIEYSGVLMWEINVWYLIFFENIDLFDTYRITTHDKQLLLDY
jgi:hypothetical protein